MLCSHVEPWLLLKLNYNCIVTCVRFQCLDHMFTQPGLLLYAASGPVDSCFKGAVSGAILIPHFPSRPNYKCINDSND